MHLRESVAHPVRLSTTSAIAALGSCILLLTACGSSEPKWSTHFFEAPVEARARITHFEEMLRMPECDNECKIVAYGEIATGHEKIKQSENALDAYAKQAQACKNIPADSKEIERMTCNQGQAAHALLMARQSPDKPESVALLRKTYMAVPSLINAKNYLPVLEKLGPAEEYQREKAYQDRIEAPLSKAQMDIVHKYRASTAGTSAASSQSASNQYEEQSRLFLSALEETSRLGLTQHDNYLQDQASSYSRYAASSRSSATDLAALEASKNKPQTFLGIDMAEATRIGSLLGAGGREGATNALQAYSEALIAQASNDSSGSYSGAGSGSTSSGAVTSSVPKPSDSMPPITGSASSPFGGSGSGAIGNQASSGVPGNCRTNLSHLGSQLPRYNHPQLEQLRNTLLAHDTADAYRQTIAQGKSPIQGAADAARIAQNAEQERQNAKQCIHQVSTNPDSVISQLENGTYSFTRQGLMDNCAMRYVGMHYGAVAMKGIAVAAACMARR